MTKPTDPTKRRPVQRRCALRDKEIRAIELAALGKTQGEIGEVVGLTRSGVAKMLTRTEGKLAVMLRDKGERIKAKQTIMLETLYREAMTAWEASKKPATSIKTTKGGEGGDRTEDTVRGQCGDPRFLDQARGCLEDVRKIWGINTPYAPPGQNGNQQFVNHQLQLVLTDDVARNALATLAARLPGFVQDDDAGPPGSNGEPRALGHVPALGDRESEAVGPVGPEDQAADDRAAAALRQERNV